MDDNYEYELVGQCMEYEKSIEEMRQKVDLTSDQLRNLSKDDPKYDEYSLKLKDYQNNIIIYTDRLVELKNELLSLNNIHVDEKDEAPLVDFNVREQMENDIKSAPLGIEDKSFGINNVTLEQVIPPVNMQEVQLPSVIEEKVEEPLADFNVREQMENDIKSTPLGIEDKSMQMNNITLEQVIPPVNMQEVQLPSVIEEEKVEEPLADFNVREQMENDIKSMPLGIEDKSMNLSKPRDRIVSNDPNLNESDRDYEKYLEGFYASMYMDKDKIENLEYIPDTEIVKPRDRIVSNDPNQNESDRDYEKYLEGYYENAHKNIEKSMVDSNLIEQMKNDIKLTPLGIEDKSMIDSNSSEKNQLPSVIEEEKVEEPLVDFNVREQMENDIKLSPLGIEDKSLTEKIIAETDRIIREDELENSTGKVIKENENSQSTLDEEVSDLEDDFGEQEIIQLEEPKNKLKDKINKLKSDFKRIVRGVTLAATIALVSLGLKGTDNINIQQPVSIETIDEKPMETDDDFEISDNSIIVEDNTQVAVDNGCQNLAIGDNADEFDLKGILESGMLSSTASKAINKEYSSGVHVRDEIPDDIKIIGYFCQNDDDLRGTYDEGISLKEFADINDKDMSQVSVLVGTKDDNGMVPTGFISADDIIKMTNNVQNNDAKSMAM